MGEPIKVYTEVANMTVYGKAQLQNAMGKGWSLQPPLTPINATNGALALADEHGIDLRGVTGSGTDGRVIKSDVEAMID